MAIKSQEGTHPTPGPEELCENEHISRGLGEASFHGAGGKMLRGEMSARVCWWRTREHSSTLSRTRDGDHMGVRSWETG